MLEYDNMTAEYKEYFITTSWQNFANAIIEKAADDYRNDRRKLLRNPRNKEAAEEISDIEEFFRSEWFCALSDVDGNYILDQLKKENPYQPKPRKYPKKKKKKRKSIRKPA